VQQLRAEVEKELLDHILPFWTKLQDEQYGGMYGLVDYDLHVAKRADKGGIVTARFLWTFSAAFRVTGKNEYLQVARNLFQFFQEKLFDHEYEGIFWLVDYAGRPKDTRKHIYTQAFAVYACSEYYLASKDEQALKLAKRLFYLIEEKGFDKSTNAYLEEFDRIWNETDNQMLSGNGIMAHITMNTHIHVLEAYTTLYKAWPTFKVKEKIENLLHILYEKIYDKETHFLGVYFDKQWKNLLDMKSFGHDIEASWLIDDAIKTIDIENLNYEKMVIEIAGNIAAEAMEADGSLINEQVNEKYDRDRIWWVQAEAAVGFYNAYERTGNEKYAELAKGLWKYIRNHLIDPRENGEWFWSVDSMGHPSKRNIADPWKASYHNGRFCLEFMKRVPKKHPVT